MDGSDRTWKFIIKLEHVTTERFLGHILDLAEQGVENKRVEFRLSIHGEVKPMGVQFEGIG